MGKLFLTSLDIQMDGTLNMSFRCQDGSDVILEHASFDEIFITHNEAIQKVEFSLNGTVKQAEINYPHPAYRKGGLIESYNR